MAGDGDIMAALRRGGEAIRIRAALNAAGWSERIPPSGRVESLRPGEVMVIFGGVSAPNAYPNEVKGVRHPVFGNREVWVTNEYRPFLAPAAVTGLDRAAREIVTVIDKWGHELGFEGE